MQSAEQPTKRHQSARGDFEQWGGVRGMRCSSSQPCSSREVRQTLQPCLKLRREHRRFNRVTQSVQWILRDIFNVDFVDVEQRFLELRQARISGEHNAQSIWSLEVVHFVFGGLKRVEGLVLGLVETAVQQRHSERASQRQSTASVS